MAVWQWKIYLIPESKLLEKFLAVPTYLDEELVYSTHWGDNNLIYELVQFFDSELEKSFDSRAAENVLSWGINNEDEVILVIEDEKIDLLGIQIDTSQSEFLFLKSLVNFAKKKNFVLWELESFKIIKPIFSEVFEEMRSSRARLFFQNPERFFKDTNYLNRINKENEKKVDKYG